MSIINKIEPLDQMEYLTEIVEDPMERRGDNRYAIFRCRECGETFEASVYTEKRKKFPYCSSCFHAFFFPRKNREGKYLKALSKSRITEDNKTGYIGVYHSQYGDTFAARIMVNNKDTRIGTYPTKVEAAYAFDMFIEKHHLENKRNIDYI